MKQTILTVLGICVVTGIIVGLGQVVRFFILPYYFSYQNPLDEAHLASEYDPNENLGIFRGNVVYPSFVSPARADEDIFGMTTGEKRIEVDLANQRLYAFEGVEKKYDFPISSGLWNRTPTGEFRIWIKLRYTRMEGGSRALGTYYYLPNVPYVMFFYNNAVPRYQGFGIHGTYWHNNFGHPMSHGCINLKTEDAEKLFYWADPSYVGKPTKTTKRTDGTRIIIYGKAPAQ
jgi:lipoprotein-anchoring transpeptidase ErfK/SrfK